MDELLIYLLNSREHVPAEKLCGRFGLTRPTLARHLARFKKSGIVIEQATGRGYRILSGPFNRIIPEMVQYYSGGKIPFELIVLKKTESTNTFAKRMAADGLASESVVVAEEQTAGRGRLDREWVSERGKDLTFSVVLKPDRPVQDFFQYTFLTSLAVCQAVGTLIPGRPPEIKWPNDVYLDGEKLCGILSEMLTEEMRIRSIVIGVGINVNSLPAVERAASIRKAAGADVDRNKLLADILARVKELYLQHAREGFPKIFREWKKRLGWIGKEIQVEQGGEKFSGILRDVRADGSAVVSCDGRKKIIFTGDILV